MRTGQRRRLGVAVTTAGLLLSAAATPAAPVGGERPAHCAGQWYPAQKETLSELVQDLLEKADVPKLDQPPIALISPHAGYRYSAPVAASAYAACRQGRYHRVIVLAFSHRLASSYSGVDVPAKLTAYSTPLGAVPIDRAACDQLLAHRVFATHKNIDKGEHSLELQLPFLQVAIKDFQLVPLLVGRMSDAECAAAAEAILPLLDEGTLLVASSDFTHYGRNFRYRPFTDDVPQRLQSLADAARDVIESCDYDGFAAHLAGTQDTICGRGPIRLLLRVLSRQGGAQGRRVAYDTSGRQSGDYGNSVTYQSFVFTKRPSSLGATERTALLSLARQTVAAFLSGEGPPDTSSMELPESVRRLGGCFVTLENHGQLRGCIGNMVATGPLCEAVVRNAVSACQDHRFVSNPVTKAELSQIDIEISYLTPMVPVERVEDIVIGRHGLMIAQGGRRGVLLPQVAYERGWTRDEFLRSVCRKARLPQGAWQRTDAQLYSFEAEVFGESEQ